MRGLTIALLPALVFTSACSGDVPDRADDAREAEGEERDRLWAEVVTRTPDYDAYQARTRRRIPVVILERKQ